MERGFPSRRSFLTGIGGLAARKALGQLSTPPIIDTHIHLFDRRRGGSSPPPGSSKDNGSRGAPSAGQAETLDVYRELALPQGVKGAIVIEASPVLERNDRILETIEKDTMIVGYVGNLEPGTPKYGEYLEKYHRNPLFLGIRYGNLWRRDLGAELPRAEFIAGLKLLAQTGLSLEVANPTTALMEAAVRVTDAVPDLRVVIDHLPQFEPPAEPEARKAYESILRKLAHRPQVYGKVTEVLRRVDGQVPTDLGFYRPRLDQLFDIFGEDNLVFGSDWPNAGKWGSFETAFNLVREYFTSRGRVVAEKCFWRNSVSAYRWVQRVGSA